MLSARIALVAAVLTLATEANAASFVRADQNNDGLVTFTESRRVYPRLNEVHFLKPDRDGDGALNKKEFLGLEGIYTQMYLSR